MKATKILVAAAALSIATAGSALAFHSGGVAECEGCHTMHNSFEGASMWANENTGYDYGTVLQSGPYLLKSSDQSGACLNCHNAADTAPSSYHISTDASKLGAGIAPVELTPGGDFAWLKKTYTFTVRGTGNTDDGDRHGHNIIASDYGYTQDKVQSAAPGGSYPAANLACSSCHDPHGKYRRDNTGAVATTGLPIYTSGSYGSTAKSWADTGVYRLLAGKGYSPKSTPGYGFVNDPPVAVVNSTYNRSEATSQTHVAYGQGMAEWCANCHSGMLENGYTSGMPGLVHPAGNSAKLTAAIASNYNAYVSSGIMTNTNVNTAYSTLAPFELAKTGTTTDIAALKALAVNTDTVNMSAVAGTSNVMCLSCHRAHASGFNSMTRYFLDNEFMTVADSAGVPSYDGTDGLNGTEGKIHHGKTMAETQAAYYGRPASTFGPWARDYCNKCHAKD